MEMKMFSVEIIDNVSGRRFFAAIPAFLDAGARTQARAQYPSPKYTVLAAREV